VYCFIFIQHNFEIIIDKKQLPKKNIYKLGMWMCVVLFLFNIILKLLLLTKINSQKEYLQITYENVCFFYST
jgi:hypothetical protein